VSSYHPLVWKMITNSRRTLEAGRTSIRSLRRKQTIRGPWLLEAAGILFGDESWAKFIEYFGVPQASQEAQ